MNENTWPFLLICGGLLVFLLAVSFFSQRYSLNNIKSKTVGDGQHGTARWATPTEIRSTYHLFQIFLIKLGQLNEIGVGYFISAGQYLGNQLRDFAPYLLKRSCVFGVLLYRPL